MPECGIVWDVNKTQQFDSAESDVGQNSAVCFCREQQLQEWCLKTLGCTEERKNVPEDTCPKGVRVVAECSCGRPVL
ncbi:hypothetical protein Acr_00g0048100 [Actinidia rufa]|uniref:Uncharacterized protein n=1 Tax=Actinidia rufa TaxID=165716 RepID=A0A7J0DK31_9ERIC|nr:hypothetical protein Acr_00g0048100 [Actinidia rufa]